MTDTPQQPQTAPQNTGTQGTASRPNNGRAPALAQSLGTKFFVLGLLVALLSIPIFFVWLLTLDRQSNNQMAIEEIGRQWGGEQTITGPVLAVPVTVLVTVQDNNGRAETRRLQRVLAIAPDTLHFDGTLNPELRHRGIHEAIVYQTQIAARATFTPPDLDRLGEDIIAADWPNARLAVSITDLKGIETVGINQNGVALGAAEPGLAANADTILPGFHVPIDLTGFSNGNQPLDISLDMALKGSQSISFVPAGRQTDVSLASSWPHPSFQGTFLPAARTVTEEGFDAQWSVPQLARAIPGAVVSDEQRLLHAFNTARFGVNLHQPVDHYRFVDRAVKYAILFVGAAFLVIFTIEVMSQGRMHLVHYMMTGLMMVVFYVLLLALAEIVGFAAAYAIAAGATGLVIAAFVASVFKGRKWTLAAFASFSLLYGALYTVLSLRDAALLTGAIAAFLVVAAMMFGTRKVDWSRRAALRQEP